MYNPLRPEDVARKDIIIALPPDVTNSWESLGDLPDDDLTYTNDMYGVVQEWWDIWHDEVRGVSTLEEWLDLMGAREYDVARFGDGARIHGRELLPHAYVPCMVRGHCGEFVCVAQRSRSHVKGGLFDDVTGMYMDPVAVVITANGRMDQVPLHEVDFSHVE